MSWNFVQSRNNGGGGDAPSAALAYNTDATLGDLLIMATGLNNNPTSGKIVSCTDSLLTVYTQVGFVAGPASLGISIWAGIAKASGPNTTTITFDTTAGTWLTILEYSNVPQTVSVDKTTGQTATSTTPDSGSTATSFNGDLIFGAVFEQAVITNVAGTNLAYTKREEVQATFTFAVEDAVQVAGGAVHTDWAAIANNPWSALLVAFNFPLPSLIGSGIPPLVWATRIRS